MSETYLYTIQPTTFPPINTKYRPVQVPLLPSSGFLFQFHNVLFMILKLNRAEPKYTHNNPVITIQLIGVGAIN